MEEEKIRSYALLMAYNLPEFILSSIQDIGFDEPQVNSILKLHKIDIYNWSLHHEDMEFLASILKALTRMSIFDEKIVFHFFNALDFEFVEFDIDIMTKRFSFVVNKYYHQNELLRKIFNNYLQIKKHQDDIEIGNEDFDDIVLKKINKGGKHLSSDFIYSQVKDAFLNLKKYHSPINKRILDNLPFDVLNEISSENYNKILTILKRKLAVELFPYINSTKAKASLKEHALGMAFVIARLCFNEEEYIQYRLQKDPFYQYDNRDFISYQRTQGKNVISSIAI